MQSLYVLAWLLLAVSAQEYVQSEEFNTYPKWYISHEPQRHRRDLTMDPKTGDVTLDHRTSPDGKVFGTLGSSDAGLFGKAGYQHHIFNDNRGKLDAAAYGSRVLGPYGDSSHLGGRLDWKNDRAGASLDVSRQIHGYNSIQAAAGGRWPLGKNGDISIDGTYNRFGPISDYGARAGLNYRW